jgi:hypothetical protein
VYNVSPANRSGENNLTIGYMLSVQPVKYEHCVCMFNSLYVHFELSVMFGYRILANA